MDPQPEEDLKRPRDPEDWDFYNEKAYINIKQWRDPEGTVVDDVPKPNDRRAQLAAQQKAAEEAKRQAALAELGEGEEPPFELERIPARTPLIQALNPNCDVNMIVHHSEVVSFIRKYLIDKLKTNWQSQFKDLKEVNPILGSLLKKS